MNPLLLLKVFPAIGVFPFEASFDLWKLPTKGNLIEPYINGVIASSGNDFLTEPLLRQLALPILLEVGFVCVGINCYDDLCKLLACY